MITLNDQTKKIAIGLGVIFAILVVGILVYYLAGGLFDQSENTNLPVITIPQIKSNYNKTMPFLETQLDLQNATNPEKLAYLTATKNSDLSPSFDLAKQFASALNIANESTGDWGASYYSDSTSLFYSLEDNSIDITIGDTLSEKRFILDKDSAIQKNADALKQLGVEKPNIGEFSYSVDYLTSNDTEPIEADEKNADLIDVTTTIKVNGGEVKSEFDNGIISIYIDEYGNVIKMFYSYMNLESSQDQYPLKTIEQAFTEAQNGLAFLFVKLDPYVTEASQINKATISDVEIYYYYTGTEGNLIPYYSLKGIDDIGDPVEILVPAVNNEYLQFSGL